MGQFSKALRVLKVDEGLGLVFGFAIISTENGEPYVDRQGDWIPEEAMLKRAAEFAEKSSRPVREMHEGGDRGQIVFMFPLTQEVAKAFGIESKVFGLMVAARPDAETLAKVKSRELASFSIGGVEFSDDGEDDES